MLDLRTRQQHLPAAAIARGDKAPMAKITVHIKHVAWRDGRPRFNPGPKLRRLGFAGRDLKTPEGAWMNLQQAAEAVAEIERDIAARRQRKAEGKRLRPVARTSGGITVADLVDAALFARQSDLADKTRRDYRMKADSLAAFDPELWAAPAASVSKPVAVGLHDALRAKKGLHMANGVLAVLRLCWSWGEKRGRVASNPFLKLGMPTPPARLRVGTPAEIQQLIDAADYNGETAIGDAIVLALYSGQRQADVLAYEPRNETDGRIRLIQRKTGARVSIPALPQLRLRIEAAVERKAAARCDAPEIVVDPRTGRAFNEHSFRHRFALIREIATRGMPSVADFLFMDLRDTAVTRLAMAGCTLPEIAAITGHSLETITTVLKHYLALNEAMADAATAKLAAWLEKEGVAV